MISFEISFIQYCRSFIFNNATITGLQMSWKNNNPKTMSIVNIRQALVFLHIQKNEQRVQRKEPGHNQTKNMIQDNQKEHKQSSSS